MWRSDFQKPQYQYEKRFRMLRLQVSFQNATRAGASKKKFAVKVKTPTGRTAKESAPVEKAVRAANGRMASPAHMATSPLAVR